MSVTLAYCHGDSIRPPFMRSVIDLITYDRGRTVRRVVSCSGSFLAHTRNQVVEEFLGDEGSDWLWFLDTDVEFPPDTLERMLGYVDEDHRIVGAKVWNHIEGTNSIAWLLAMGDGFHPLSAVHDGGLIPVTAIGMACALIHREVFEAIREDRRRDDDPWVWYGHDLVDTSRGMIRVGEDVSFCARAQQVGFRVYGLADVEVDHHKVHPLRRECHAAQVAPSPVYQNAR